MDKERLKKLIDEVSAPNAEEEIFWQANYEQRLEELKKDLAETIEYIDTCSKKELEWIGETFDELSEYFKSRALIDCVERNVTRFDDPELQETLKKELGYMKFHLPKRDK